MPEPVREPPNPSRLLRERAEQVLDRVLALERRVLSHGPLDVVEIDAIAEAVLDLQTAIDVSAGRASGLDALRELCATRECIADALTVTVDLSRRVS